MSKNNKIIKLIDLGIKSYEETLSIQEKFFNDTIETKKNNRKSKSNSFNRRKVVRMARILTIFGSNESSRRDLVDETFSNARNERKVFDFFEEKKTGEV